MKTAQEAAREYSGCKYAGTDLCNYSPGLTCDPADCYAFKRFNAFLAGVRWAEEWISVKDEWPKDEDLILAKDPDGHIDLMQGWQMKERIKPYAVDDFYTAWRPIERKTK